MVLNSASLINGFKLLSFFEDLYSAFVVVCIFKYFNWIKRLFLNRRKNGLFDYSDNASRIVGFYRKQYLYKVPFSRNHIFDNHFHVLVPIRQWASLAIYTNAQSVIHRPMKKELVEVINNQEMNITNIFGKHRQETLPVLSHPIDYFLHLFS